MTRPTKYLMAILSSLLLLAAACGDDSGSGASSEIDSEAAWCAVVEEVDADYTALDEGEEEAADDFAAQQEIVAGIGEQLDDLKANLDQVDEEARDAVQALLDFNLEIADAYAAAGDPDELSAAVGPLFEADQTPFEAAGPWILEHCGVEV